MDLSTLILIPFLIIFIMQSISMCTSPGSWKELFAQYSMTEWQREIWREANNLTVQVMGVCLIGAVMYILINYYLLPLLAMKHL